MQIHNKIWERARDPRYCYLRSREQCKGCVILIEGFLIRERILANGRRQIVGLYVPGDVCGLTAFSNGYADHNMIALSSVSYLTVPDHWLSLMALGSADLSQALWQEMSREAAISAAWIVNLGQRSAYERIAYFFCELEARLRAAGHDTAGGINWPGNQADIGAATGLSLVHVNRTLHKLEADQLVSTGRHMRFHDIAKLRIAADFDPTYLGLEHKSLADMLLKRIGASDEAGSENAFRSRSYDALYATHDGHS